MKPANSNSIKKRRNPLVQGKYPLICLYNEHYYSLHPAVKIQMAFGQKNSFFKAFLSFLLIQKIFKNTIVTIPFEFYYWTSISINVRNRNAFVNNQKMMYNLKRINTIQR